MNIPTTNLFRGQSVSKIIELLNIDIADIHADCGVDPAITKKISKCLSTRLSIFKGALISVVENANEFNSAVDAGDEETAGKRADKIIELLDTVLDGLAA